MELHSIKFLVFFAVVFTIYYLFRRKQVVQNIILLAGSYFFYAYASAKMLPIIVLMTLFFYYMGILVDKYNNNGKDDKASTITTITIIVGLLPLFYFKYFDFFITQFIDLFNLCGLHVNHLTMKIILPLGLSFYTFRLLSYVLEINQGSIVAEKDFLVFSTYVAYFPSLIAGPIDRPNGFIMQLHKQRMPDYSNLVEGMRRFVWGLFMKICVADRMAVFITDTQIATNNGCVLFIVALMSPFWVYCDFAGYSHMAIGVSRMLGIVSAENFNRPFFAQNIADYWRRWHMSLTSWVTDYVYTPLSFRFREKGKWGMILAIYINLFVISFWHGANWNNVIYGLYHATLFVPIILGNKQTNIKPRWIKGCILHPKDVFKITCLYLLVMVSFAIFLSSTPSDILQVFNGWFSHWRIPTFNSLFDNSVNLFNIIVFTLCGVVIIIKDYFDELGTNHNIMKSNKPILILFEIVVFVLLVYFLRGNVPQEFIYKQF